MELAKPIKQTQAVSPIVLGNLGDCESLGDAIVTGWGASKPYTVNAPKTLQQATVSRINNKGESRLYFS